MKWIIAFSISVTSGITARAVSDSHIVLFKQNEVAVTSLDHGSYQQLLQVANSKSVSQLKQWARRESRAVKVNHDLWLVRGAAIHLAKADVERLRSEPWVAGIYADNTRSLLPHEIQHETFPSLAAAQPAGEMPWGLISIGVPQLQAEFPHIKGNGVRVGILDTGIQSGHVELKGRLVAFRDFVNGIKHPYDDQGHGTHVAGTIAGANLGVAPGASLVVAKVFSAIGSAVDSEILAAMQWVFDPDGNAATADHPQVVSNSWGGEVSQSGVLSITEYAPYWLAIQAWVHGGIIPVFAAGNSGASPNAIPGGLPEPISVGAYGADGKVGEFSSRGPNLWKVGESVLTILKPDVSAPGAKILSCIAGNQYATWDGTSMATPHVAGALALALQANPKLRFAEAKELLLRSSAKKYDVFFGFGTLDAFALVKLAAARNRDGR